MVGQPRGAPALVSALLALAALSPWPALAADQVCDPDAGYLSGPEYLRAVSLDLRGRPPSLEECELLGADGEVSGAGGGGVAETGWHNWKRLQNNTLE